VGAEACYYWEVGVWCKEHMPNTKAGEYFEQTIR